MLRTMESMTVICIDITTRCPHQCSACTRLVGHVKPRDMDLDTCKKAIDSLDGHKAVRGIIGGEPLLHKDFAAITEYLVSKTGGPRTDHCGIEPITDLSKFLLDNYRNLQGKSGLFTSLPPCTINHWEQILESYRFIGFNTHTSPGLHQQLLIGSGELPMPEEQKKKLRESCWVNRYWSCGITPQGCWPCEIMGSLAHAFDGPGPKEGWPIEKGWWKRKPKDWGDMLKWCEICGAAMDVPRKFGSDNKELVSPENYERLKKAGSSKVKRGLVEVFDVANYDQAKYKVRKHVEWYLPTSKDGKPDNLSRVKSTDNNLKPRKLECVIVCVGYSDFLDITLPWNMKHWDKCYVVTSSNDIKTQEVAAKHGAQAVISDSYKEKGAKFNKGRMLNAGVKACSYDDWIMFTDADILLPPEFRTTIDKHVWNPGGLYYGTRLHTPKNNTINWVNEYKRNPGLIATLPFSNPMANQMPWGYLQLFHSKAQVLSKSGRQICSEGFFSAGGVDNHFMKQWPTTKRHLTDFKVIHIDHGSERTNWNGRRSPTLSGFKNVAPLIANDGWTAVAWLDENGYNHTFPTESGGYLKMYRSDTGESIIIPNSSPPRGGFINNNDSTCNVHHVGFVTVAHKTENKDSVIVYPSGEFGYSGWGLGHTYQKNGCQGYVWNGCSIAPTKFELFQKQRIVTIEDHKLLINVGSISPLLSVPNAECFRVATVNEKGYTPINEIPNSGGYIKLIRKDTGEFVVTRYLPASRGLYISGPFLYGAHHIGIISKRFINATDLRNRGKVIVHRAKHNAEYSGWGMGHMMFEDKQAYAWGGKETPKTEFDLFWLGQLTPEETKYMVVC